MELLIVTGMSGAGKTQAANALEDVGFFCVDNIPSAIISPFVDLYSKSEKAMNKIVVVTDVRGSESFSEISDVLEDLKNKNIKFKILFLDASDQKLVRRYKETRRKHPLMTESETSLKEAVEKERKLLNSIRNKADYIIDTSLISIVQLKENICNMFFGSVNSVLKIQCKSFGFKYGYDNEADLLFDVRCLPNPYYIDSLKFKTGLNCEVRDYVMSSLESNSFYEKLIEFLDSAVPLYAKEGKSQLTISIGCTGGKHRSVAFAELIGKHLKEHKYDCVIIHRDINKR